jgi:hypothetical protein
LFLCPVVRCPRPQSHPDPNPIPKAPRALPWAIPGRRLLTPSSRASAIRNPPASNTATESGFICLWGLLRPGANSDAKLVISPFWSPVLACDEDMCLSEG